MELRRFTRAPLEQPLEFHTKNDGRRVAGLAKDISVGGMFVQTEEPAAFGTEVIIYLTLRGDAKELRLPGVVRWTSGNGMGVQFRLLGVRETHAITEIVTRNEG